MKRVIFFAIFAAVIIGGSWILAGKTNLVERLDVIASNPNPFIRHFAPTWRSLKKIIDIPYLVRGALANADLPIYEIATSRNDRINLLKHLPNYPKESRLYEFHKDTVKATFRHGNYETAEADIRYRGKSPEHWSAVKKSWQVNLPEEKPLRDRATLRFFVPSDKGWVRALLWEHLAETIGFFTPEAELVWLSLNNSDAGVYVLLESWEESFFEKRGRAAYRLFAERDIPTDKENLAKNDLLRPEGIAKWHERIRSEGGENFPELLYLLTLAANADDEVFEKEIFTILNKDHYYRWMLASLLAGNFRQSNLENLNLLFNAASGAFEPIFFDPGLEKIEGTIDVGRNRLANRVLKNARFKGEFEKFAAAFLADDLLEESLRFYDDAAGRILPATYRDTKKLETSFEVARSIQKDRAIFEHNFLALKDMLGHNGLALRYAKEIYPLSEPMPSEAFGSFRAVNASRQKFLRMYPQFVAGADASTVILLPGIHSFKETTIIPKHLVVIIREGARLRFAPEISLISYSPVIANGSASSPIIFEPLLQGTSWGVISIINANAQSVFSHVIARGGADATINGLYFSGMLSIRNSDVEIRNALIESARADDGIHVLRGKAIIKDSVFQDNTADSIDLDFASKGSLIAANRFSLISKKDANGDAVDLSFSTLRVERNVIEQCSDKGISIGEASQPFIGQNRIKRCAYGIAVKDRSKAKIENNILEGNEVAIGLYRKKPHFIEGGKALLSNNTFIANQEDISADSYSSIMYEN